MSFARKILEKIFEGQSFKFEAGHLLNANFDWEPFVQVSADSLENLLKQIPSITAKLPRKVNNYFIKLSAVTPDIDRDKMFPTVRNTFLSVKPDVKQAVVYGEADPWKNLSSGSRKWFSFKTSTPVEI
jgi:hypothetical protein